MKSFLTAAAFFGATATSAIAATTGPDIWAHRGATYLGFENTLEAFELGAQLGASGFELDLVVTKDNQLAVFHDLTLNASTNVEMLFDRSRARAETDGSGGTTYTYYVEDFTMAELRTLTLKPRSNDAAGQRNVLAKDPNNPVSVAADYRFRIPSYADALDLLDTTVAGQKVLTEVKMDNDIGTPEKRQAAIDNLIAEWTARGYTGANSPIVVQSFSRPFMQEIDAAIDAAALNVPTFQLDFATTFIRNPARPMTQDALNAEISANFGNLDGLALFQGMYLVDGVPFAGAVNPEMLDYVAAAKSAGLQTYVWTLTKPSVTDPAAFLQWLSDPQAPIDFGSIYQDFFALGLDGIITDTPSIAIAEYERFVAPVPLPAGVWMLLSGIGLMVLRRRR